MTNQQTRDRIELMITRSEYNLLQGEQIASMTADEQTEIMTLIINTSPDIGGRAVTFILGECHPECQEQIWPRLVKLTRSDDIDLYYLGGLFYTLHAPTLEQVEQMIELAEEDHLGEGPYMARILIGHFDQEDADPEIREYLLQYLEPQRINTKQLVEQYYQTGIIKKEQIQALSAKGQMLLAKGLFDRAHRVLTSSVGASWCNRSLFMASNIAEDIGDYDKIDQKEIALYIAKRNSLHIIPKNIRRFDRLTADDQAEIAIFIMDQGPKQIANAVVFNLGNFLPECQYKIWPRLVKAMHEDDLCIFFMANYINRIKSLTLEIVTDMIDLAEDHDNFMAQALLRAMDDDRVKPDELDQIKEFLNSKLNGLPV